MPKLKKKKSTLPLPQGENRQQQILSLLADRLDPEGKSYSAVSGILNGPSKKEWQEPPDVVDWASYNFIDPIAEDYIQLVEHQQRLLRKVFRMIWDKQVVTVVYSDVKKSGKCAYTEDRIVLATGEIVTFGSLIGKEFYLNSADNNLNIIKVKAKAADNGVKVCIKITTSAGDSYIRTEEHPFYVNSAGWVEAKNLKLGHQLLKLDGKLFTPVSIVSLDVLPDLPTVAVETENGAYISTVLEHNTTLAGLVGSYWANFVEPPNEIITVANDQEQAQGRIYAAMIPTMKRLGWYVPEKLPSMEHPNNGTKIRAIGTNYAGEAGGGYGLTLWSELWAYRCVDEDTYIYTKNGWKSYKDIKLEDDVYVLRLSRRVPFPDFERIEKINIYQHTGKMLSLEVDGCSVLVTDNHRVVGKFWNNEDGSDKPENLSVQEIKSVLQTYRFGEFQGFTSQNVIKWKREDWELVDYDGKVWCPTVKEGTFLMKRKDKIIWTGNSEDRKRLWEEMTPVPIRKYSIRWVETYAGFLGESDLLWNLYCQAFKDGDESQPLGVKVEGLEDLPCYWVEKSKLLLYWNHEPRMPWQTPDYYEQQRADLRPSAFLRLHRNMWVSSKDIFIEPVVWDSLEYCDPLNEPDLEKRPIILGADASTSNDSTALVAAYWDQTRKGPDILGAWSWTPAKVEGQEKLIVDLSETLKAKIVELLENFDVIAVYYDAFQLHSIMTDLQKLYDKSGLRKKFVNFPQSSGRVAADQAFYQFITTRNLKRIASKQLRDHVLNAVAIETERGYRLAKDKTSNKIDLAVAASMACYGASLRNKPPKKFIKV